MRKANVGYPTRGSGIEDAGIVGVDPRLVGIR